MNTANTAVLGQHTATSTAVHYEESAPTISTTTEVQTTIWTAMMTTGLEQSRQWLDDMRWEALFQDPRSDRFLDDLVEEILGEGDAGLTRDIDELL